MVYVAGVDEAGRGCLYGDVVVAAVVLDPNQSIEGLADSKKLSAKKRAILSNEIKNKSLAYSINFVSAKTIDRLNILQATLLGMKRSIETLSIKPALVYIDGNHRPKLDVHCIKVIKGDQLIQSISAASILAKVARDEEMMELHDKYPQYRFDKHKGYPTKLHIEAMTKYGLLPNYRKSYKPVQKILIKN